MVYHKFVKLLIFIFKDLLTPNVCPSVPVWPNCLFVVCFLGVTTLWLYFPQPRSGL